jgi:hypothetical protein
MRGEEEDRGRDIFRMETRGRKRALQRHSTESSKQVFPVKELRGLSPNFHSHVSASELYIPRITSAYSVAEKYVDRSWEYINRS